MTMLRYVGGGFYWTLRSSRTRRKREDQAKAYGIQLARLDILYAFVIVG